ncbi:hypothetical protein [Actinoplanes rectilineatus]|uniref:hypothetical protein n=1 Tax=Actinoplanes rectilineatus TaxID=113571 RepID=UPI0005F27C27|nr:hypothetical protein [Actinoplanes rectilineatus]
MTAPALASAAVTADDRVLLATFGPVSPAFRWDAVERAFVAARTAADVDPDLDAQLRRLRDAGLIGEVPHPALTIWKLRITDSGYAAL